MELDMADEEGDKKPKTNYASNSQKSKEDPTAREPRVQKVVTSDAVERKKPLSRKIVETFSGDDAQSVGSYILFDVVIPATKNLISDMVSQGIERLLFGDSRGRALSNGRRNNTQYNKMYTNATRSDLDRPSGRSISDSGRRTHDFREIIISDRGEAEEVIDTLIECIGQYDVATITDLYDMLGISGNYVDDKWGWTDLRGASVRSVRGGYLLDLPRPIPLD